jgi:PAS domain S-box-containing protein
LETEADETEGLAERFLSTRPGLSTYLAPINGPNEETGILAVHRAEKLSPAEGSLVEALASQIYVKQENERLFQETLEQKGHLADVIGVSSDGIFVVSPDRRIMSWNPAMERITQFTREEAVEADCDEIIRLRPEPDGRGSEESTSLVLISPQARDALAIRKDRTERWIRYTSNAMPDRDGRAKAYVVVARDVTAELEAERLKDDFVATVSHELRTPLTPLKGFIVSLEQGLVEDSPESRQEYYGIMRRQAERLERLINDLLDVSRIESGSLRLEPQIISLAKTIEEQIRELEPSPIARPVSFVASDDPVWVLADPLRVGQVVANLLSNAFKYSPPGTPVEAQLVTSESHARVSIHNEGEGLSAADQERVFDRFYRVESTMTRTVGGVGLGLYIAKRLVEAMGGELGLESRPGMGCTFSFTVPLSEDPANRAAANGDGPSALAAAGPGERAA